MRHFARALRSDRRGVAAMEFAILCPVFILFMLSMVEVYSYFRAAGELDRVTYSVGNLAAQRRFLIDDSADQNSNDLGLFWEEAPLVAEPLDLTNHGTVILTEVDDAGHGVPTIAWQRKAPNLMSGDQSRIKPNSPLPANFPFNVGDNTLVVEVFYHTTPFPVLTTFWPAAAGEKVMYRVMYFHPRYVSLATLQAP